MVMPLKSCCCGIHLRTGTIIIAVLGVLAGIVFLAEGIIYAGEEDATPHTATNATMTDSKTPGTTTDKAGHDDDDEVEGEDGFSVVQAIYGCIELLINILLLAGAIRNKAKQIYPWIFVNVILCFVGLIAFLGMGILICVKGTVAAGIVYMLGAFILTAIHVYCILVVNSFHSTLKAGPMSRA